MKEDLLNWFDSQRMIVRVLVLASVMMVVVISGFASIMALVWFLFLIGPAFAMLLLLFVVLSIIAAMVIDERDDNKRQMSETVERYSSKWRNEKAEFSKRVRNRKV